MKTIMSSIKTLKIVHIQKKKKIGEERKVGKVLKRGGAQPPASKTLNISRIQVQLAF